MENKFKVGDRVSVRGPIREFGLEKFDNDGESDGYRKATVTNARFGGAYMHITLDKNGEEYVVHTIQLRKLKKRPKIVRYIYKSPDGTLGDVAWEDIERPRLDRDWKWIKLEEVRE